MIYEGQDGFGFYISTIPFLYGHLQPLYITYFKKNLCKRL
jgi:hypothetical protein